MAAVKKIDAEAGRATVMDLDGEVHELRELWREGTVVLVFLRHFG